jgi:DNA-binding response OmpR family regulator
MGDSRVVDTTVKRLRKKLDPFEYIQTIFGVGYKMVIS